MKKIVLVIDFIDLYPMSFYKLSKNKDDSI